MKTMSATLGVDAGGTSTDWIRLSPSGTTTGQHPGLNALLDASVVERLSALIRGIAVDKAGIGLAGIRQHEHAERIQHSLRVATGADIAVGDDLHAAHLAAFDDQPGIVIVAGTGTNALGVGADGNFARAGGHGYLIGDEGSGYWIGRQIVARVLEAADGGRPVSSELCEVVSAQFAGGRRHIEHHVYAHPTNRSILAHVTEAAAEIDDTTLDEIFAAAVQHLLRLFETVHRQVGSVSVAMVGGLWRSARIRIPFEAATGALAARRSPAEGAALLLSPAGRHLSSTAWPRC